MFRAVFSLIANSVNFSSAHYRALRGIVSMKQALADVGLTGSKAVELITKGLKWLWGAMMDAMYKAKELTILSKRMHMPVGEVAALSRYAETLGINIGSLGRGFQLLGKWANSALSGTSKSAVDTARKFNLTNDQLRLMASGGIKSVLLLKKHLEAMGVSAARQSEFFTKIFGRRAFEMEPLLSKTSSEIEADLKKINAMSESTIEALMRTQKLYSKVMNDFAVSAGRTGGNLEEVWGLLFIGVGVLQVLLNIIESIGLALKLTTLEATKAYRGFFKFLGFLEEKFFGGKSDMTKSIITQLDADIEAMTENLADATAEVKASMNSTEETFAKGWDQLTGKTARKAYWDKKNKKDMSEQEKARQAYEDALDKRKEVAEKEIEQHGSAEEKLALLRQETEELYKQYQTMINEAGFTRQSARFVEYENKRNEIVKKRLKLEKEIAEEQNKAIDKYKQTYEGFEEVMHSMKMRQMEQEGASQEEINQSEEAFAWSKVEAAKRYFDVVNRDKNRSNDEKNAAALGLGKELASYEKVLNREEKLKAARGDSLRSVGGGGSVAAQAFTAVDAAKQTAKNTAMLLAEVRNLRNWFVSKGVDPRTQTEIARSNARSAIQ